MPQSIYGRRLRISTVQTGGAKFPLIRYVWTKPDSRDSLMQTGFKQWVSHNALSFVLSVGACGPDLHAHARACRLLPHPTHGPGCSSGTRPAATPSFRASRAGAPAPARTPSASHTSLARFAHALATPPDEVSHPDTPGRPVVGLPAEELADLVVRLEEDSSKRRGQLHVVGLVDVADDAPAVVNVAEARRSTVCSQISSWKVSWRSVGSRGSAPAWSREQQRKVL